MKSVMPYIYILVGFLVGFLVGAAPGHEVGFPLQRFGYDLLAFVVILLYMWFERTSHKRHLSRWRNLRRRSRLYFVLYYYILARAIPILLLLAVLINTKLRPAPQSVYVLVFTSAIALVGFVLVGNQEWSTCESDFSIQSMEEAARRLKETGAGVTGGGAV